MHLKSKIFTAVIIILLSVTGCDNDSADNPGEPGTLKVEIPAFDPAQGTYTLVQTVTINCATDGAEVYYTTDGSEPDTNGLLYTSPLTVSNDLYIGAVAVKDGYDNSDTAWADYKIYLPNTLSPPAELHGTVWTNAGATLTIEFTASDVINDGTSYTNTYSDSSTYNLSDTISTNPGKTYSVVYSAVGSGVDNEDRFTSYDGTSMGYAVYSMGFLMSSTTLYKQ
ncbi:MAG TPA: chitobiase/beta-hexosaminidase C-terminal domain-containing protein [Spirochaetota bacterium]|nr:chitobiase/beta-hexosaminidase C-terminal domain-containing protein [Spirochaetota bacterium]